MTESVSDSTRQNPRLRREEKTVRAMVRMHCRSAHRSQEICPECAELIDYAAARLKACPYGERKPTCAKCPIHCYRPEMRARMRAVMRFSGPRILLRHPVLAVRHILDGAAGSRRLKRSPPASKN